MGQAVAIAAPTVEFKRMRLDREDILRKDFKRAVRGYDPWEVEAHLREVNNAIRRMVDDLVRGPGGIA